MPGSGQVDEIAAGAPPGTPPVSLSTAMQCLFRAYQKTSIYPPGHPAVPAALADALAGLTSALSGRDQVTVRVSRGKLLVDDEPLAESRESLGPFSELLRELDLVALEFHRGLTLGELDTFIHELGRAKRDDRKGPASTARGCGRLRRCRARPLGRFRSTRAAVLRVGCALGSRGTCGPLLRA